MLYITNIKLKKITHCRKSVLVLHKCHCTTVRKVLRDSKWRRPGSLFNSTYLNCSQVCQISLKYSYIEFVEHQQYTAAHGSQAAKLVGSY